MSAPHLVTNSPCPTIEPPKTNWMGYAVHMSPLPLKTLLACTWIQKLLPTRKPLHEGKQRNITYCKSGSYGIILGNPHFMHRVSKKDREDLQSTNTHDMEGGWKPRSLNCTVTRTHTCTNVHRCRKDAAKMERDLIEGETTILPRLPFHDLL